MEQPNHFVSIIISVFCSLLLPSVAKTQTFPDTNNYWGKECINQMKPRRLVTGYPDGTFRPNNTITRAEFAVLMLNAFPAQPTIREGITFKDVSRSHWAYNAIQDAYKKGFFTGYPGNIFQPNQAIPRVQAIAILANTKKYSSPSQIDQTLAKYYQDASQIPNYAKQAIAAASTATLVVNYPNTKQLRPNQSATRGETAALLCRALNIYAVPPQYIAGVEVHPQEVRSLPGSLDDVPVFNSNSPELVRKEGILLSTFPPTGKANPQAHLNYAFNGRFDIFSHHLARAENSSETNLSLYQGLILHNPTSNPVKVSILQAASYLGNPDAPFISLPDVLDNNNGSVYSGPGSRVMGDILRGVKQDSFPNEIIIPPTSNHILFNQPIPVKRAPASNGRSTMIRLRSDGNLYVANLALKSSQPPTLNAWLNLLSQGDFAQPRDSTPTPLDPPQEPTVFGRVGGISLGSQWQTRITENDQDYLKIPEAGKGFSYVLGTLHLITLSTGQIQSAPMVKRYQDTAYFAHSNYGVEYKLTLPLKNTGDEVQTVEMLLQTPLKDEGGNERLLFLNPQVEQIFFRGTVRLTEGDNVKYFHLVQRRGQPGETLVTLRLQPGEIREVNLDFIYPPDVTPPQVLTVRSL